MGHLLLRIEYGAGLEAADPRLSQRMSLPAAQRRRSRQRPLAAAIVFCLLSAPPLSVLPLWLGLAPFALALGEPGSVAVILVPTLALPVVTWVLGTRALRAAEVRAPRDIVLLVHVLALAIGLEAAIVASPPMPFELIVAGTALFGTVTTLLATGSAVLLTNRAYTFGVAGVIAAVLMVTLARAIIPAIDTMMEQREAHDALIEFRRAARETAVLDNPEWQPERAGQLNDTFRIKYRRTDGRHVEVVRLSTEDEGAPAADRLRSVCSWRGLSCQQHGELLVVVEEEDGDIHDVRKLLENGAVVSLTEPDGRTIDLMRLGGDLRQATDSDLEELFRATAPIARNLE